jgi:aspartate 1-decarboxylase
MKRITLRSKIHGARVTAINLEYEGSIEIDEQILDAADMLPNEMVLVVNITTGTRFETYIMRGERGSRVIALNGGAARLGEVGDELIVMATALASAEEIETHIPRIVRLDAENRVVTQ